MLDGTGALAECIRFIETEGTSEESVEFINSGRTGYSLALVSFKGADDSSMYFPGLLIFADGLDSTSLLSCYCPALAH